MKAASTSETLVNIYQTRRRYNPEDSHLDTPRCANIKSCLDISSILHVYFMNFKKTAGRGGIVRTSVMLMLRAEKLAWNKSKRFWMDPCSNWVTASMVRNMQTTFHIDMNMNV
jgi:hypothetical protein